MKLIHPYFNILSKNNGVEILQNLERAGRTCYKSEDKITPESSVDFIKMLINRGHESVLEHEKITVLFVCDRGVSHELVRHRIASFSQESTRYCNYSKNKFDNQITFIMPHWLIGCDNTPEWGIWMEAMRIAEMKYNALIEHHNWKPEQARSVLPNALKTEIVVTANIREWRLIFKQRTSNNAHPQMRELMRPLLEYLKMNVPVVFDDIIY